MPLLRPTTAIKSFSFSYYFSAIFMLGFVPIYLSEHGLSKLEIGSVYALGPFIGVFANLFWGAVSDRYQVVKRLLFALVTTMLAIVITLNFLDSYSILLVFMVVLFFAQTAVIPLSDSLTLLTIQPLGHTFASYRIYGSFGFAIAALVINRVLDKIGYHYTLWIYASALFMVLLATSQLTERVGHQARPSIRAFMAILKNKELLFVLISLFVIGIANRTNDNFIALYLHDLGLQSHIGLALMCSALSEIPVFILLSKYGTRFREVHLLALAGLFFCIRYLIVAFEPSLPGILIAQLMHSVTFGIAYITAIRYVADLVPSAYRASGQALFAITFSGASGIISGIAGGWLFATYSGHLLYLAMAGCGALACGLFLLASRLFPRT